MVAPADTRTVSLKVPADPDRLPLIRSVAAATAATMGFSIDAVEDLRLAVSEACNELFAAAVVTPITVELRPDGGTLEVAISATIPESSDRSSSESTLSWLVLEALTEHPSREVVGDRFVIRFSQTVVHERSDGRA